MSRRKEQFRKSRSVYWRREIHPLDYVIAPSPSSLSSIFEVLSQDRQDALNRLFEKRRRGLKAVVRDPVLTSNSSATSVVTIMPTFRSRPPTTPTHASYRLKAGPSSGSVSILVSDASAYSGIASCSSYADSVYSGIYKGLSRSQDVCLSIPASASGARSSAIPRSSTSRRSLVQAANVQLGAIDEERLSVSPEQMRNEFEGDMDSPGQDLKIRRIPSFDAPLMHSTPISRPLVSSTPIIPDDPICASPAPVRDKSDSSLPSTPLAPISNSNSNKTLSSLSSPIPDRNKLSSPPLPTGNRLGSPSRKIPSKQLSSPSSATPDKSTGSLRLAPPSRLPVLKARKSTCSIRPE
ncbi:hypothetical protein NEOLEDRAFT_1136796 [Neolentinus lepideus HHB14362 ss-1]|uniref:Uncharacterized protein n=1 Tax=Neolentinus lepideus HHB14362 ss-1 TaxID=1314782 RepID=A0A165R1H9_9AGAM|nr:hypothetical protein NEOLEDRAFT_1136796 [Neolentinus lepideus HHB14362 ss-1]